MVVEVSGDDGGCLVSRLLLIDRDGGRRRGSLLLLLVLFSTVVDLELDPEESSSLNSASSPALVVLEVSLEKMK